MKKDPLTIVEHVTMGAEMFAFRQTLVERITRISNALPLNHPAVRHFRKALTHLDLARSAMDSVYHNSVTEPEFSELGNVWYGANGEVCVGCAAAYLEFSKATDRFFNEENR